MSPATQQPIVCDHCGRRFSWKDPLAGKKVKCPCGESFTVPAAPPIFSDEQSVEKIKGIIGILAGMALVAGLLVGGKYLWDHRRAPAPPPPPVAKLPGMDNAVMALLQSPGGEEALQWLHEDDGRGIVGFIWTHEKTQKTVQMWYAQGAKKVLAFGSPWTRCLAIELPNDPHKRAFFFDYFLHPRLPAGIFPVMPNNTYFKEKTQHEEGQKYVLIDFMPNAQNGLPEGVGDDIGLKNGP